MKCPSKLSPYWVIRGQKWGDEKYQWIPFILIGGTSYLAMVFVQWQSLRYDAVHKKLTWLCKYVKPLITHQDVLIIHSMQAGLSSTIKNLQNGHFSRSSRQMPVFLSTQHNVLAIKLYGILLGFAYYFTRLKPTRRHVHSKGCPVASL